MFASKESCVREITERILRSQLTDEEALSAVFNIIRLYRETPNAFSNFREMEEPLNISDSFPWDEAGREGSEYWQNVNAALVGVFQTMTDGCDYPVCAEADEQEDAEVIEFVDAEPTDAPANFNAIGPIIKGWGLFDREKAITVPAFFETRSEAHELKSPSESVVRAALFTIDESNSSD